METATLKNGAVEAKALVEITMLSLMKLGPIELYELVQICRRSDHPPWGDTIDTLKSWQLVGQDGVVHDSIKNIVLSAAEGDGLDLRLGSPIKKEGIG